MFFQFIFCQPSSCVYLLFPRVLHPVGIEPRTLLYLALLSSWALDLPCNLSYWEARTMRWLEELKKYLQESVMWICIRWNTDPDPGSASACLRIRIQGVSKLAWNKKKLIESLYFVLVSYDSVNKKEILNWFTVSIRALCCKIAANFHAWIGIRIQEAFHNADPDIGICTGI